MCAMMEMDLQFCNDTQHSMTGYFCLYSNTFETVSSFARSGSVAITR